MKFMPAAQITQAMRQLIRASLYDSLPLLVLIFEHLHTAALNWANRIQYNRMEQMNEIGDASVFASSNHCNQYKA
jgi:hypothetical protein